MKKQIFTPVIIFLILGSYSCFFNHGQKNENHTNNRSCSVPNSIAAVKIALATWYQLYGDHIYTEQPFVASLDGDSVWTVNGTGQKSSIEIVNGDTIYHMATGGVAYIRIRKLDGKILDVGHGK